MSAPRVLRVAALLALCAAGGCERATERRPPDVILIVIDTQRAESMSLYGYERETSPHLRQLARDSVNYWHAISPGTWTVPAHASLFTGRWPSFHGAERVAGHHALTMPIDPEAPTLAELLHERGWRTGGFVANGNLISSAFGFGRGFDRFVEHVDFVRASDVVAAGASWLAESPQPSFLFLNLVDTHEPYLPPPPFDRRFPGRDESYGAIMTKLVYRDHAEITPAMRAHFVSQYDGATAYVDKVLGGLFVKLRSLRRYDSSLVIVTSDHGELLGEHGLAGHGIQPFEQVLHVPLVVRYPCGRGAGQRVTSPVSTLGVFATILGTLGIDLPEGTQSVPLDRPQRQIFAEDLDFIGQRVRVAYRGSEKLVAATYASGQTRTWLYDLSSDPGEQAPIHERSRVAPLRAVLDEFGREPRPALRTELPEIDPEHLARLRALGYLH